MPKSMDLLLLARRKESRPYWWQRTLLDLFSDVLGGSCKTQIRTEDSNYDPANRDHPGSSCVEAIEEKTARWSA